MNTKLIQDLTIVSPLFALLIAGFLPLLIKVINGNKEPNPFLTMITGFVGILVATVLTLSMAGGKMTGFSEAIVLDGISVWVSYLVYLVTAVSLMISYDSVVTKGYQFAEFMFLMLSSAIGMLTLALSNDLIVSFIGIELMSLCLYILVAMSKESILSKEAAFKYFVLGSFASAIMLYGVSFIYGTVGSTYLPQVTAAVGPLIGTNRLFLVGLVMLVLGLAFKVSIFPFHSWTPDVYHGSPTPVTAFMATSVKAVVFVLFIRLFNTSGLIESPKLLSALQWLAVLTMFAGNVGALMQSNFKRVLAYSSVAHSGYLLVGLIAAGFGNHFSAGASGVMFYLFSYTIMTLGSFAIVSIYERSTNSVVTVDSLKGMGKKHPVMAMSLTVLMLSLAGVPPTLGFFGKFYIFSAAIEQDFYWLALWGVVNSVISVCYYLRPVVMMYMSDEVGAETSEDNLLTKTAVLLTAIMVIVLGLFSSPVLKAVQESVKNLL